MRQFIFSVLGIITLLSLQSCALTLLDLATPNKGYTLEADIAYGEHKRQRLDFYSPTADPKKQTIIFFYGGAWDSGNKDHYRFVAQAFAEQGYTVVIPDYRIYPDVKFPVFIEDAAASVKWASEQNDNALVLMGHSAGAHIAAMVALDKEFLGKVNIDENRLAAWVGLAGPYDFLPFTSERISDIFSTAKQPEDSQPIYFANHKSIPALLVHGEADKRVLSKNSKSLARVLRQTNTAVTEHYYPDASHSDVVGSISVRLRHQAPTFGDVLAFLSAL